MYLPVSYPKTGYNRESSLKAYEQNLASNKRVLELFGITMTDGVTEVEEQDDYFTVAFSNGEIEMSGDKRNTDRFNALADQIRGQ